MHRERQPKYIPEIDDDGGSVFPEKRLWTATILNAITDYEEQLRNIRSIMEKTGKAPGQWMHSELRILRYEIEHDWFKQICLTADQSHGAVLYKLDALDKQYGLREIIFSDDDTRVTRYSINKAKRQQEDS